MGFLKPSYVPDGYTVAAISQSVTSGSSGNSSKVTVRYSGPATGNATSSLSIEQTQGGPGLQEAPSGATKVDVNGATGYETTLSAVHVLSWQAPGSGAGGAVGVVLRSPSLSFEELLKVARSMK